MPVHVHSADERLATTGKKDREASILPYLRHPAAWKLIGVLAAGGIPKNVSEVRTFEDDAVLDVPGRPRVLHAPGHTHGCVAFHFERHGVLVAGDVLYGFGVLTGTQGPQIGPRAFNASSEQALESLSKLEGVDAEVVLFGHGEPWTRGVDAAVAAARATGPVCLLATATHALPPCFSSHMSRVGCLLLCAAALALSLGAGAADARLHRARQRRAGLCDRPEPGRPGVAARSPRPEGRHQAGRRAGRGPLPQRQAGARVSRPGRPSGDERSEPLRVLSTRPAPPSTDIYDQAIPSSGYGYLTTRDGTKLAYQRAPAGGRGQGPAARHRPATGPGRPHADPDRVLRLRLRRPGRARERDLDPRPT